MPDKFDQCFRRRHLLDFGRCSFGKHIQPSQRERLSGKACSASQTSLANTMMERRKSFGVVTQSLSRVITQFQLRKSWDYSKIRCRHIDCRDIIGHDPVSFSLEGGCQCRLAPAGMAKEDRHTSVDLDGTAMQQ
jgi:hypothetical protein